jgi:hypothetical protein
VARVDAMQTDPAAVAIVFVHRHRNRDWRDLELLDEAAITRQPQRFVGGRNSWVAQTYLRTRDEFRARGWAVRTADRFEPGAITVVHRDDMNEFRAEAHGSFLVVVRADRAPVAACDLAIVQNRVAPAAHERFLPLWPQPGLQPRDARRGTRIVRIAYQGRNDTAPPWFRDEAMHRALARRGATFEVRTSGWDDYRGIDLVIAAREDASSILAVKPATKIYNAWLAHVPVLATPEPAYNELRRNALDFIEIRSGEDVVNAVDLLRANPGLYQAMVANGIARGGEYDVESTRKRWISLFDNEVVPRYREVRGALASRRRWFLGAMVRQKTGARWYRLRLAAQRWAQQSPWTPTRIVEHFGRTIARGYVPEGPVAPRARR